MTVVYYKQDVMWLNTGLSLQTRQFTQCVASGRNFVQEVNFPFFNRICYGLKAEVYNFFGVGFKNFHHYYC